MELTESQKSYFNNRINLKAYRYWVVGINVLKTKKKIIEALGLGLTVSCKSKTSSEFHALDKGGF